MSAVSETFLQVPPQMSRTDSEASTRSADSQTTPAAGSDGALNAFFNLTGARSRAGSKAERGGGSGSGGQRGRGKGRVMTGPITLGGGPEAAAATEEGSREAEEERALNPWAHSRLASLGKGVGGGLSRGLRERGSDSTIRGGK